MNDTELVDEAIKEMSPVEIDMVIENIDSQIDAHQRLRRRLVAERSRRLEANNAG